MSDTNRAVQSQKMICDKVLSCRGGLTKHMARHSSVKPFICELCGKGVSSRSHLVDHMRRHTGERPYKCTIEGCNKTFRTLDCRSRHEVLHFNDYPFICDFCGTKFKRRNELRTHRRRKHELEFPWQCDYCPIPEKFKTIARFKNHMARLHVDKLEEVTEKTNIKFWRCEHCAKVFGSKDDFQQHVNIHLGLRPYICALCQKSFSNKSNLLQHKKSHFKKDLLQCPSCPKSYKDPSMFKEHLKNKHGSNIQEENITDPKGFKERLKTKYGSDKHDDNVTSDVEVDTRHCRLDRVEAVDQNQILSPGGGWPVPRSIPSDRREADPSYVASVWVPGSSLVPPRTSQDWEGRTGFIGGNHF